MGDYNKISDLIQNDHHHINKLYRVCLNFIFSRKSSFFLFVKNYQLSRGNLDDQQRWSHQIQNELLSYLNTEETILYPYFEKDLQLNLDQLIHNHKQVSRHIFNHFVHFFFFFFIFR